MMKDFKDREVDCAITFEDFIDKKVLVHAIPTGGNAKDGLFTGEPSGITYGFATVEDYYKYAHWYESIFSSKVSEVFDNDLFEPTGFNTKK